MKEKEFDESEIWEVNYMLDLGGDDSEIYFENRGEWGDRGSFWNDIQNTYCLMSITYYSAMNVKYPFKLMKIDEFLKKKTIINPKNKYLVDCGIYDILKNGEYDLSKWEFLKNETPENCEFTIPDYPLDIVGNDEKWIEKTFENIKIFSEKYPNANLLPSIQFKIGDFESFKKSFFRLLKEFPQYKRIGIGNLCKQRKLGFFKQLAEFLKPYEKKGYSFHIFGMTIKAVKFFNKNYITFDSTKWDSRKKAWNPDLKCFSSGKTRKATYFYRYLQKIYNYWVWGKPQTPTEEDLEKLWEEENKNKEETEGEDIDYENLTIEGMIKQYPEYAELLKEYYSEALKRGCK